MVWPRYPASRQRQRQTDRQKRRSAFLSSLVLRGGKSTGSVRYRLTLGMATALAARPALGAAAPPATVCAAPRAGWASRVQQQQQQSLAGVQVCLGSRIGARNPRQAQRSPGLRTYAKVVEAEPATVDQEQLVSEVKRRLEIEHSSLRVGKNGRDDDDLLLWFLRDRKFDVDATVAKLSRALEWRRDFGVDDITEEDIGAIAASGKAYLHSSPDVQGRPVVVVKAANHFPDPETLVASEKLCIHLIETALSQLPPGGEKMLGIFDLRGFTSKNGDLKFVKFLVDVFFEYYPKRMGEVLFVDAPFIFQPGWNIVKPLLKSYANLVKFCSAAQVRETYFTPDTVPPDFLETSRSSSAS